MPSSRIAQVVATATYYAIARHVPNRLGGTRIRGVLCRHIFKEMGINVHIAENVYFGRGSNIIALDNASLGKNMKIYGAAPVVLGVHCIVGPDVTLVTGDHRVKIDATGQRHVLNLDRPITVGDYTFVCANTTVVGGVTLERNSLVAAGSVVTRDVEAGWMYGGVPARKIRPLERLDPGTDGDYVAG